MDDERISQLEIDIAGLRAAIDRARTARVDNPGTHKVSRTVESGDSEPFASRRAMLKLAGAALAGAAAATAVTATAGGSIPVAATPAPSFHPVTPTRVYDSRSASPNPGPVAANLTRDVSIADGRDLATGAVSAAGIVPAGTTAIACNVTVTNTTGAGYLTVNPGGNNIVTASTINWFGSGQVLANGVIVTVSNDLKVTVIAGGGGQTDFVIDVTGYFQ